MIRAHNFNPGPAVLPWQVIEETRNAVENFNNSGMSLMEISHRAKDFDAISLQAEKDGLQIMGLSPDEYSLLFIGGGASTQFAMVPMNFLYKKADYVNTGAWSQKAIKEAKMIGEVNVVASSEAANFNFIPKDIHYSPDADYVHITTNNTIFGTEWKITPDVGNVPLIADMSSDILSRRMDFSKYNLIYAGAQKNLGPAGVVVVVIKKSWAAEKAKEKNPTMLKYKTHIENASMYNTPPVLPVYVVSRVFKWIMAEGGLEVIEKRNIDKAALIYDKIDAYPDFYKGAVVNKEDRSLMNITWNLPNPELEAKFVDEAKKKHNMIGLKGHRSVGGVRASTYNACPVESCETLAKFMEEFYKENK